MTNKKKLGLFIFGAACLIGISQESKIVSTIKNTASIQKTENKESRQTVDHNNEPVMVARNPASVSYVNTPSPEWESKLKNSLKEQGGNLIKEINVKKERSLVYVKDENSLQVESVVITVKNQLNVQSSFRALVDSQTGKVLESWDRTIFDPANVREGLKIKLDPRYTK
jgi:hypothetical protein